MTTLKQNPLPIARKAATIASGAAVSGAIDISEIAPRGLAVKVPSAWTAADIGFEVGVNGTDDWIPVYDKAGARVKITTIATGAARLYVAPPEAWAVGAYPFLRLASLDTADGGAENQGAARALTVVLMS